MLLVLGLAADAKGWTEGAECRASPGDAAFGGLFCAAVGDVLW